MNVDCSVVFLDIAARQSVELEVHPCLDYTLMDYTLMDYSWLDYRHLDYLWHLDYRRLDYFRLQGRSDYKDIWTIAIWTINQSINVYSSKQPDLIFQ